MVLFISKNSSPRAMAHTPQARPANNTRANVGRRRDHVASWNIRRDTIYNPSEIRI